MGWVPGEILRFRGVSLGGLLPGLALSSDAARMSSVLAPK